MVQLENTHWSEIEHSPFLMPYVGHLVVHSLSGEELSEEQQFQAGVYLTDSGDASIRTIELDADPYLPRLICNLNFEASGDAQALRELSSAVIDAWASIGKDPDDLEFVEAHLAYSPQLEADRQADPTVHISDAKYTADELELPELNDFDEPVRTDARRIFLEVQAASTS